MSLIFQILRNTRRDPVQQQGNYYNKDEDDDEDEEVAKYNKPGNGVGYCESTMPK